MSRVPRRRPCRFAVAACVSFSFFVPGSVYTVRERKGKAKQPGRGAERSADTDAGDTDILYPRHEAKGQQQRVSVVVVVHTGNMMSRKTVLVERGYRLGARVTSRLDRL